MNVEREKVIKVREEGIEGVRKMGIWDIRLVNSCLVGVDQGKLFDKTYAFPVDLETYARLSGKGYRSSQVFSLALESAKKLRDTPIEITLTSGQQVYTSIVYEVYSDPFSKVINLHWNSLFIPLISGNMPAGKFLTPKVAMASVGSPGIYALYLLIENNLYLLERAAGQFLLSKERIREVIGIQDTYPAWSDVTKRFIKPTLKAIYAKIGKDLVSKTRGKYVIFHKRERGE